MRAWPFVLAAGLALGAQAPLPSGGGGDNSKPIAIEAANGIEWQQNNHVYIARGHAAATRGDDKVTADTLMAYYRELGGSAPARAKPDPLTGSSSTQIYRIEAEGHVVFTNPNETMTGDSAVYDVDSAALVVTGKGLKIVTPRDTITARDSLEWYDQKQLGVARGNAVAVQGDRRVRGDVLTAQVTSRRTASRASAASTPTATCSSRRRGRSRAATRASTISTPASPPDRPCAPDRGENELRGRYAVVDLNNNVSRLLAAPPGAKSRATTARRRALVRAAAVRHARSGGPAMTQTHPAAPPARRGSSPTIPASSAPISARASSSARCCARSTSRSQRGEAVGLLGPNGAGKTTCFYIITGLIRPDVGTVTLDGEDITDLPMYRRARLGIGYLPQEASIFRGLTVEQNIRAVLEVSEPDPEVREETIDALLAEFSISHLRRAPALALSGGERRRVEIARALATRPHFILLDEPFAGIDPIAVTDIRDLVAHLKDRGIGVLITDHNVRETLAIIDRAYILHEGQVLMEGAPDDIVNDADVRRVYLGDRFSR